MVKAGAAVAAGVGVIAVVVLAAARYFLGSKDKDKY